MLADDVNMGRKQWFYGAVNITSCIIIATSKFLKCYFNTKHQSPGTPRQVRRVVQRYRYHPVAMDEEEQLLLLRHICLHEEAWKVQICTDYGGNSWRVVI